MNYWIFKANPEQYRIDDRLLEPAAEIVWAVTRYHERIQKGDTVFVWRAGTPRGICAVMLVEACPYEPDEQELNDGFELPLGGVTRGTGHWAKCRLIKRFQVIDASVIKKIEGLELFSFFSAFQQATNFTVTRPEASILLEFIETSKPEPPVRKVVSPPKPVKPVRQASVKKSKPAASTDVSLLKCASCGRFVVSTDTDRHVREAHDGLAVAWKKTK